MEYLKEKKRLFWKEKVFKASLLYPEIPKEIFDRDWTTYEMQIEAWKEVVHMHQIGSY